MPIPAYATIEIIRCEAATSNGANNTISVPYSHPHSGHRPAVGRPVSAYPHSGHRSGGSGRLVSTKKVYHTPQAGPHRITLNFTTTGVPPCVVRKSWNWCVWLASSAITVIADRDPAGPPSLGIGIE